MAETTFDPRFDPAYQRGYEPSAHASKAASAPVRPVPADSIGEPPVGTEPKSPEDADAAQAVAVVTEPFVRRGVNTYVVILWVIGVIFTLGGAALLFTSYIMMFTNYTGGPAQAAAAQAVYVFGSAFGVPVITVGLATIAGLIFFSAWRSWRRSESSRP